MIYELLIKFLKSWKYTMNNENIVFSVERGQKGRRIYQMQNWIQPIEVLDLGKQFN